MTHKQRLSSAMAPARALKVCNKLSIGNLKLECLLNVFGVFQGVFVSRYAPPLHKKTDEGQLSYNYLGTVVPFRGRSL